MGPVSFWLLHGVAARLSGIAGTIRLLIVGFPKKIGIGISFIRGRNVLGGKGEIDIYFLRLFHWKAKFGKPFVRKVYALDLGVGVLRLLIF